jgi:hypothetical protein
MSLSKEKSASPISREIEVEFLDPGGRNSGYNSLLGSDHIVFNGLALLVGNSILIIHK